MASGETTWAEPRWQRLNRHRPKPGVPWKKLVQDSETQVAYYHPSVSPERQQEIELRCVREGVFIKEKASIRTYYLDVGDVVGASAGEETTLVFAEWARSGEVHGRPITRDELQRKGAAL